MKKLKEQDIVSARVRLLALTKHSQACYHRLSKSEFSFQRGTHGDFMTLYSIIQRILSVESLYFAFSFLCATTYFTSSAFKFALLATFISDV